MAGRAASAGFDPGPDPSDGLTFMPLFPRFRRDPPDPEPDPDPAPSADPDADARVEADPKLRRLFLDDDPLRARTFLAEFPDAVWVSTVAECIAHLADPWDEVHLDHDLGGEHFVDIERDDCGMEVVRWLCLEPRPHLSAARFFVHSHNPTAAMTMGMRLISSGYRVELRPFGAPPLPPLPDDPSPDPTTPLGTLIRWMRRAFLGDPETFGYGYTAFRREGQGEGENEPPPRLDLSWTLPRATAEPEPDAPGPPEAEPGPPPT